LLAYRQSTPALLAGAYRSLDAGENCFVFERTADGQRVIVALNFSDQQQKLSLSGFGKGTITLSTMLDREDEVDLSDFSLRANEGCIITF
jgi:alpha-glucosidase